MSDVAASGGYYIASGATKIFALDDTLTGSIGVVGGKIAPGRRAREARRQHVPDGPRQARDDDGEPRAVDRRRARRDQDDDGGGLRRRSSAASPTGATSARTTIAARSRRAACGPARRRRSSAWSTRSAGSTPRSPRRARSARSTPPTELEVYPPAPTLRDVLRGVRRRASAVRLGARHAELAGGAARAAIARSRRAAADRLLELVMSFRTTTIQARRRAAGGAVKRATRRRACAARRVRPEHCAPSPAPRRAATRVRDRHPRPRSRPQGPVVDEAGSTAPRSASTRTTSSTCPAGYDDQRRRQALPGVLLPARPRRRRDQLDQGRPPRRRPPTSSALDAIVVMPDGDDGFYVDSVAPIDYDACMKDGTGLFMPGDAAARQDLRAPAQLRDVHHPRSGRRRRRDATARSRRATARAIAGLSMGGFGALELAMRHPDLFAAAASHSGVDVADLRAARIRTTPGKVELITDVDGWGASPPTERAAVGSDAVRHRHRALEGARPDVARRRRSRPASSRSTSTAAPRTTSASTTRPTYLHDCCSPQHIDHSVLPRTGPPRLRVLERARR